jgi:hypothetical protein
MYVIQVDVNGFKYYINKDHTMYLQGLQDNATKIRSEYEARAIMNVFKNKIIWPLSIKVIYSQ